MTPRASGRTEQLIQTALLFLLVVGCWLVLQPFFSAILFSVAVVVSSWPMYRWLLQTLGGRQTLASLVACALVAIAVVVPVGLLFLSVADGVSGLLKLIEQWRGSDTAQVADRIAQLPAVGAPLQRWWQDTIGDQARLHQLLGQLADPARKLALATGRLVGNSVLQILLMPLLLFVLFRDGEALGRWLQQAVARIGGDEATALLVTAQRTVAGVMFSVLGTALAQAMVATLGFAIVGAPNPFLLGALTFVLSMAPIGPPMIWGGVTLWLLKQDQSAWAVFMALYGLLGISSVDNVIKPFLISRSSHLPFVLTFIGVVGGVVAFGIAGAFVGPTLLALGLHLSARQRTVAPPLAEGAPAQHTD